MALTIDLPHNSDGEVDWNTFGNILTGELLGQIHCASFLDPLYGSKQRGLIPETNWEYVGTKHNIVILKKRVEGTSLDSFMGRGVIDFPIGRVAQYIGNMEQTHLWERYLADIRCIKQLSEDNGDTIVYRRYQATACLMNFEADFVYYLRSKFHGEQFVHTAASVSDMFYPPTPGVFRGKMLPGSGHVLEPYMGDPNRTLVTYMAAVSIDGVPAIATNKVIQNLSISTHYLNKHLKRIWIIPHDQAHTESNGGSEHLSKLVNDAGNSDMDDFNDQRENEIEIQASMMSSSDIECRHEEIQEGRNCIETHQVPDYLYKNGEVDWDVLGEEITRRTLQEVESFRAVDVKYGSGTTVPQHKNQWRFVFEKHDVVVYTQKQDNSTIDCFLGCGVVDAPMKVVSDFLQDIQSTFSWDNTVTDAQYVKVIQKSRTRTDFITCLNYETTKCLVHAKRENLSFVRCVLTDEKFVMSAISVEHPDCPPPPDTTRVKVYSGSGWVMEPYRGSETQTLVTYLAHVDLMGLPSVIANYVLRSYPLAVHYVRLHLPPPPHDTAATSYYPNTGAAVGNSEPIALLSDIGQRLNKGWSISGWNNAT